MREIEDFSRAALASAEHVEVELFAEAEGSDRLVAANSGFFIGVVAEQRLVCVQFMNIGRKPDADTGGKKKRGQ